MKARKVRKKILNRTMDFIPYEFGHNYLLLQSVYGSRNLVKVNPSFMDGRFRSETRDVKRRKNELSRS